MTCAVAFHQSPTGIGRSRYQVINSYIWRSSLSETVIESQMSLIKSNLELINDASVLYRVLLSSVSVIITPELLILNFDCTVEP